MGSLIAPPGNPVSSGAGDRYHARTGKRVPERPMNLALRRLDQALLHAFQIRRGTQVTTTTVTFSAIGQPQHITAPRHAVPYCVINGQC